MLKIIIFIVCTLVTFSTHSYADIYKVSVTRKSKNIYKIDGKNILLQTRYCYEYAYSEDSFLEVNGYSGEITFKDSKETCDIKAIYGKVEQGTGRYAVTISQEEDDWYEIFGSNMYIKTDSCLSLALGEEAILEITAHGFGTLYVDSNQCMVEGIYSKLRF